MFHSTLRVPFECPNPYLFATARIASVSNASVLFSIYCTLSLNEVVVQSLLPIVPNSNRQCSIDRAQK